MEVSSCGWKIVLLKLSSSLNQHIDSSGRLRCKNYVRVFIFNVLELLGRSEPGPPQMIPRSHVLNVFSFTQSEHFMLTLCRQNDSVVTCLL